MHVERTIAYDGDLRSIQTVLVSQELANARADSAGLPRPEHTLKDDSAAPETITVLTVPATKLPDKVKRLISKDTVVTITQSWDGTGPEQATATFTIDAGSLPVKVSLTQSLLSTGNTTSSTYAGEVTVSIPIIGRRVEQAAAGHIDKLLVRDQKLVNDLLADR